MDWGGFFWPIFPIVGWGIGVIMNAWDMWWGDAFDEEQIRREMERLQDGNDAQRSPAATKVTFAGMQHAGTANGSRAGDS